MVGTNKAILYSCNDINDEVVVTFENESKLWSQMKNDTFKNWLFD